MRAKRLEAILGSEFAAGEAEMVQRFQKLRDNRLLPVSRGRNAEDVSRDEIVSGLLSMVASRPGFAGNTTIALRSLAPVGGPDANFAKAATFAEALHALLTDTKLLDSVVEIRITDSEIYTNSFGRGTIYYRADGKDRVTNYVGRTAVSLLQPGMEKDYDPRDLISSVIIEVVILPRVLKRIVCELTDDEARARIFTASPLMHPAGLSSNERR
jgi:hypothetical protein